MWGIIYYMSQKLVPAIKSPKLKREHAGKWVVMSSKSGKIITSANTLIEALKKTDPAEKKTVFRVVPDIYAGAAL